MGGRRHCRAARAAESQRNPRPDRRAAAGPRSNRRRAGPGPSGPPPQRGSNAHSTSPAAPAPPSAGSRFAAGSRPAQASPPRVGWRRQRCRRRRRSGCPGAWPGVASATGRNSTSVTRMEATRDATLPVSSPGTFPTASARRPSQVWRPTAPRAGAIGCRHRQVCPSCLAVQARSAPCNCPIPGPVFPGSRSFPASTGLNGLLATTAAPSGACDPESPGPGAPARVASLLAWFPPKRHGRRPRRSTQRQNAHLPPGPASAQHRAPRPEEVEHK